MTKSIFMNFWSFFCITIKTDEIFVSVLYSFCVIYAILYKKPTAELGRTFLGAFRPSLTGRTFFRMSASKSGGCLYQHRFDFLSRTAQLNGAGYILFHYVPKSCDAYKFLYHWDYRR